MALLIRRYKGHNGMMQEERIDDDDRIERYFRLFEKDDIKKLETGVKVFIKRTNGNSFLNTRKGPHHPAVTIHQ